MTKAIISKLDKLGDKINEQSIALARIEEHIVNQNNKVENNRVKLNKHQNGIVIISIVLAVILTLLGMHELGLKVLFPLG